MITWLNETITIKRSTISVTNQRVIPGSWTTIATGVKASIQNAGSTEQTLVTGLAPQKSYNYWALTADIEPEDEIVDSNSNKYRVVTVEKHLPSNGIMAFAHCQGLMEAKD